MRAMPFRAEIIMLVAIRRFSLALAAGAVLTCTACGPSKEEGKPNPNLGPPPDIKPSDRGGGGGPMEKPKK
jgi:hypothetical protein